MSEEEIHEQLHDALVEHWNVPDDTVPTEAALLTALAARVQDLMLHDPYKLSTAMYTLDVSEHKFEEALMLPDIESQAEAIAQLVIEREARKVESWKRYQQDHSPHDEESKQPIESPED